MSRRMERTFGRDWNLLAEIREEVADFLKKEGLDADTSYSLSMAACELAENALKYGRFSDPSDTARLQVVLDEEEVIVQVSNKVGPEQQEHLARLDEMVQWIRGFQDPFEAYVQRLKQVSAQSLTSSESGLGLVRIAYEAGCIIDFILDDSNRVHVSASYRLAG
ncbi:MAG: ATP-binding protein [Deltaproteobacteria bacterium]|nr:MAG: ATP-binding protein [Deltaproteobacteria bacterium]